MEWCEVIRPKGLLRVGMILGGEGNESTGCRLLERASLLKKQDFIDHNEKGD